MFDILEDEGAKLTVSILGLIALSDSPIYLLWQINPILCFAPVPEARWHISGCNAPNTSEENAAALRQAGLIQLLILIGGHVYLTAVNPRPKTEKVS